MRGFSVFFSWLLHSDTVHWGNACHGQDTTFPLPNWVFRVNWRDLGGIVKLSETFFHGNPWNPCRERGVVSSLPAFHCPLQAWPRTRKKKQLNSVKTSHVFSAIHVVCFRLCPSSNVLSGVVILTLKSSQCPLLLGGCTLSTPHKKCNPIFPLSFRGQKEIFVDSGCRVQEVPETKVVVCQGECWQAVEEFDLYAET